MKHITEGFALTVGLAWFAFLAYGALNLAVALGGAA